MVPYHGRNLKVIVSRPSEKLGPEYEAETYLTPCCLKQNLTTAVAVYTGRNVFPGLQRLKCIVAKPRMHGDVIFIAERKMTSCALCKPTRE